MKLFLQLQDPKGVNLMINLKHVVGFSWVGMNLRVLMRDNQTLDVVASDQATKENITNAILAIEGEM